MKKGKELDRRRAREKGQCTGGECQERRLSGGEACMQPSTDMCPTCYYQLKITSAEFDSESVYLGHGTLQQASSHHSVCSDLPR